MNKIFVFGSNPQGRHGKGAARTASEQYGAVYGYARGMQGNSYAIVTKELRPEYPAVTLVNIAQEVFTFLSFAERNPHLEFYVTKLGCGLAGFTEEQISPLFRGAPSNVELPEGWRR